MRKFFEVQVMCGHVGRNNYIPINFAVAAENGKVAAAKARWFPRVKHHHKNAILGVSEITFGDYVSLKKENDSDQYLHCKNIQQQRQIKELNLRFCPMPKSDMKAGGEKRRIGIKYKRKKYFQLKASKMEELKEYYSDSTEWF